MSAIQRFWTGETTIDFFRQRFVAYGITAILTAICLFSLATKGLNFGLDFTGGTLVEVSYPQAAELEPLRAKLSAAGFEGAIVQHFGSSKDVSVRVRTQPGMSSEQLGDRVFEVIKADGGAGVVLKNKDSVSDQVGDELAEQGGLAVLVTIIAVLIYVAVRFEWKLAAGAIVATFHDAIVVLGIFSIFQLDFDLTVMAAVMALLGYSLNDTVVIFDRIRENFRKVRKGTVVEVMNASINQTLARTTMTSGLTFVVCAALFMFGGPSIHEFSLALLIGVVIGTYSSIFVASAFALDVGLQREDLLPTVVEKEGADQEALLP